jgi:uncharacterized protein
MDYRRFGNTVIARFDRGEEVQECLRAVCEKENIRLASISALGATDKFTVGVYNVDEQQYHALTFTGAHEIVSLTGTVSTMNGEYYSHLHMSAANEAGTVVGGHLNAAYISATCEMVITVIDGTVDRVKDENVGLNVFKF